MPGGPDRPGRHDFDMLVSNGAIAIDNCPVTTIATTHRQPPVTFVLAFPTLYGAGDHAALHEVVKPLDRPAEMLRYPVGIQLEAL